MPDDQTITDGQPQGHRAGAWVVLLMGIVGLGLGIYQWHGSFKSVFASTTAGYKSPDQIEAERVEALKSKDTDGDGLTDYDEIYVFKTSPYLADSDADGLSDKQEVDTGTDPNCPQGKTCSASTGYDQVAATVDASSTVEMDQMQAQVQEQLMNPTPDQIRQLLTQSGMKAQDLQGIDDATLLDLYHQSLQEAQAQQSQAQPTQTAPTSP